MNIAIPVWEGKVSPVFDTASRLLIFEMDNQKEASRREIYLDEEDIARRSLRIQRLGVDVLICGAVSRYYYRVLVSAGIHVVSWISGSIEEVLAAYLEGNILNPKYLMPGCSWDEERNIVTTGCQRLVKTTKP